MESMRKRKIKKVYRGIKKTSSFFHVPVTQETSLGFLPVIFYILLEPTNTLNGKLEGFRYE